MSLLEVIVIVIAVSFVVTIFGIKIYKIINHKPSDACEECHNNMKMALKRMKREAARNKKKLLKQQNKSI
jgi:mannitol-specific phosphotransferase system IIBC component